MNCRFHKHKRAKSIKIRIYEGRELRITVPYYVPYKAGEFFLYRNKKKILEELERARTLLPALPSSSREDYIKYKERARLFLYEKLDRFNSFYNFRYERVSVKDQRSRWGSCSCKKNLNFSYKIIFLPEDLADYIVVHELCHLGELSHSPKFWKLVERTIPDHKERKRKLKRYII